MFVNLKSSLSDLIGSKDKKTGLEKFDKVEILDSFEDMAEDN